MKTYKLYDSHYKMKILVCVGGTKKKAFTALLEHIKADGADNPFDDSLNIAACCLCYNDEGIALWFKNKKAVLDEPGVVAHECLHATNFILQCRGVKPATEENDEHYCYYHGWLVDRVHDFVSGG